MKKITYLLIVVLAFLLPACQIGGNGAGAANALLGTSWELLSMNGSAPIPNRMVTIVFEEDGAGGSTGCNTYFGGYTSTGNQLSFDAIGMTEMACLDPEGIMEQEQAYLGFLSQVVSYTREGDRLMLETSGQGQLVFSFVPEN